MLAELKAPVRTPADRYCINRGYRTVEQFREQVVGTLTRARRKIIKTHDRVNIHGLFGSYDCLVDFSRIWATQNPEKIYKVDRLYHATGSPVVDALVNGRKIVPSMMLHEGIDNSHRGVGNYLRSALPECFGIDLAEKDSFVWTGTSVDNEGLTLEHQRAQSSQQDTEELLDLIFIRRYGRIYELQPQLKEIYARVSEGVKEEPTAEQKEYIDKLLKLVFPVTLLREGWFTALKSVMYGRTAPSLPLIHIEALEGLLAEQVERKYDRDKIRTKSQGVVIELDPQTMFREVIAIGKVYPFIPGRDPDEIVPVPFVSINSVRAVYAIEPENISPHTQARLQQRKIPLNHISELPQEDLLDPTKPAYLEGAQIDAENALCIARYRGDRREKWRRRLLNGDMVPVYGGRLSEAKISELRTIFGDQLMDGGLKLGSLYDRVVMLQAQKLGFPGIIDRYMRRSLLGLSNISSN